MIKFNYISFLLLFQLSLQAQVVSHTVCANDNAVKRYFVTNPSSGMQYDWILNNGGNVINETNDTLYVVWGDQPGIYEISLIGTLSANCVTDTAKYYIEVIESPDLVVSGNEEFCVGENITLTAMGSSPVEWSNGQTGNTATFSPNQSTTVWAIGGDGSCRSDTVFVSLNPLPLPIVAFTANPSIGEVPLTVTFDNHSVFATDYEWNFGDGNFSFLQDPTHTFTDTGSYTVTLEATNAAGCSAIASYTFVKVLESFLIFVPNAFTPNGDPINPVFKPLMNIEIDYTLSVYNRWGELLFSKNGNDVSWDGIFRNNLLQEDIYTWQISFIHPLELERKTMRGRVMLMQ